MPKQRYFLWVVCLFACLLYSVGNRLLAQHRSYVFEHINREDGLASNTVPAILQDREGFIWFGTNNGLQRYDGEKFITYHYQHTNPNSLASDIIESLVEDNHGNIWIASAEAVTLFSPDEEKFTRIPLHENHTGNLSFKRWILSECKGRIFLSSLILTDVLYVYDPARQTFIPYSPANQKNYSGCLPQPATGPLTGTEPYTYLTDRHGNTWAAGDYLQVRFKGHSGFERVLSTQAKYGIAYNLIYTLTEDREGTLWAGTDKGVYYFNPAKQQFFSVPFSATDRADAAVVSGFLEASDGKIWVSSLNQGIAVFDQQFQLLTTYPKSTSTSEFLQAVWSMVEEPGGSIWAGCEGGYLARVDPQSGKIEYFRPPAVEGQTLVKGVIDQEGIIWWGTHKGQIVKHIPSTQSFTCLPAHDTSTSQSWGKIKRILPGNGSFLWIATERGGIFQLHKTTGRITHRFTTGTKPLGLLSNEIGDIRWLTDSTLAVSSKLGIHFIDTARKSIRTLTTENGLPSNAVLDIMQATPQRLFFTTQSSLHSYHAATRRFTTYGTRDGILQESFAFNTGYRLSDGRILLGTLQNFFYFHPDSLLRKEAPPQVLITGFSVFDREIPLNRNGDGKNDLHLAYDQNFFRIEYASLSYYEADKVQYYYKLEGVDQEWVKAGKVRFASYTGIAGGTYLFKVKAERDEGSITPVITTLSITVALPFWKSPWFALGILLLTGVSIAFIYKIRLNRLLAMQQVRSRIAQDLHDDMGSTLSTIHILSELARQQASIDADKTKGYVNKINTYSQQMLQSIDDIVWSINPFNDSLQNLTARMREFATELLESNGIAFNLQVDPLVATQPIPMEARYDYFMIYKEAIHNAARHAQATNVQATIAIENRELVLTIQDDGKGFDQNSVTGDKGGNGLLNMQNRAKAIKGHLDIDTKPGSGTKVTLKAPLSKSWTYFTKKR